MTAEAGLAMGAGKQRTYINRVTAFDRSVSISTEERQAHIRKSYPCLRDVRVLFLVEPSVVAFAPNGAGAVQ